MSRTILLTRGRVTVVDEADYEQLATHKWYYQPRHPKTPEVGYAARKLWWTENGKVKQKIVLMHREILGAGKGEQVDHADGDTLNNRRQNLRLATRSQNGGNSRKKPARGKGRTSRYKGVSFVADCTRRPWKAQLGYQGRKVSGGHHATEEAAARAYDRLALENFGAYAKTNFPTSDYFVGLSDGADEAESGADG